MVYEKAILQFDPGVEIVYSSVSSNLVDDNSIEVKYFAMGKRTLVFKGNSVVIPKRSLIKFWLKFILHTNWRTVGL